MAINKLCPFLLCLFCLISIISCSSSQTAVTPIQPSLKLGLLPIEDNLPFFVAENDGLFSNYDLSVQLIPFNSARERDIALEAGEIDGALADIVAAALLKKGGARIKIVSLALGATPKEGRFVILAAPDSNIFQAGQLAGSPIAVSQHTIIHYLAEEMLRETVLPPMSLTLQNIPDLQVRFEALLAGTDVKAALLPDPLAALAEVSGARPIIDDTKLGVNLSQTVILFREETLEKRGPEVRRALRAYAEAAASLNKNPKAYKELIIDKVRIPKALEDSYRIPSFSQPVLPSPDMISRVINWMIGKGLLEAPFSYKEMVAQGYLD